MKLSTIACARAVRDGGINAVAALDYALRPALVGLCDEDAQELKLAFGHAMSDLIDRFINPAVRAFPELHPDDATWAAVVTERAAERGPAMIAKKGKD